MFHKKMKASDLSWEKKKNRLVPLDGATITCNWVAAHFRWGISYLVATTPHLGCFALWLPAWTLGTFHFAVSVWGIPNTGSASLNKLNVCVFYVSYCSTSCLTFSKKHSPQIAINASFLFSSLSLAPKERQLCRTSICAQPSGKIWGW